MLKELAADSSKKINFDEYDEIDHGDDTREDIGIENGEKKFKETEAGNNKILICFNKKVIGFSILFFTIGLICILFYLK